MYTCPCVCTYVEARSWCSMPLSITLQFLIGSPGSSGGSHINLTGSQGGPGSSCLHLIQCDSHCHALSHSTLPWCWDPNPGPHAYAAITISTEAFRQCPASFPATQIVTKKWMNKQSVITRQWTTARARRLPCLIKTVTKPSLVKIRVFLWESYTDTSVPGLGLENVIQLQDLLFYVNSLHSKASQACLIV